MNKACREELKKMDEYSTRGIWDIQSVHRSYIEMRALVKIVGKEVANANLLT